MLNLEKNTFREILLGWFERLDPSNRKKITIVGSVLAIFLVSAIIITSTSDNNLKKPNQKIRKVEYTLFNGKSPRDVSIDAMAGKIKKLTDDFSEIRTIFQRQDQKIKEASDLIKTRSDELDKRTEVLAKQTGEFAQKLDEVQNSLNNQVPLVPINDKPGSNKYGGKEKKYDMQQDLSGNAPPISESDVAPSETMPKIRVVTASGEENKKINKTGSDSLNSDVSKKNGDKKINEYVNIKKISKDGTPDMFLPAGSILSGTLITGLDAPTANQSKQDPFPALLRVKHDAILPNRYRMDIRECFLISSGYGDLSAERAYMRAERISCVKNDGSIIETAIDAYSVGEDGKAGVRGRLVSKNGQIIGNALLSGFVSGITHAFAPQRIQSLQTNVTPGQPQPFQYPSAEMLGGQALMGGVKGAAQQIAEYYLEMAKNIFPIIEIDAGRKIDFIMIRGISLTAKSKNSQGTNLQGGSRHINNTRIVNQDMAGNVMSGMPSSRNNYRGADLNGGQVTNPWDGTGSNNYDRYGQ